MRIQKLRILRMGYTYYYVLGSLRFLFLVAVVRFDYSTEVFSLSDFVQDEEERNLSS
jgi:hypothetical protein